MESIEPGTIGPGPSYYRPYRQNISADGRFVVFHSSAIDLVEDDTNGVHDVFIADNALADLGSDFLKVEKIINNSTRQVRSLAAKLATGTRYRQSYRVTNNSTNRLYRVQVFDNGNMVCNFYVLAAGQTSQRCDTFQTVLEGDQYAKIEVTANVSAHLKS